MADSDAERQDAKLNEDNTNQEGGEQKAGGGKSGGDFPKNGTYMERLRWAKEDSRNQIDFFFRGIPKVYFHNECGAVIHTCSMFIIHVLFIAFGVIWFDDCPAEKYIPIWLIVAGCAGLIVALSDVMKRIYRRKTDLIFNDQRTPGILIYKLFELFLGLFYLAWFICGCYWAFTTYGNYSKDSDAADYCNKHLFMYAFVACLIMCGMFLLVNIMFFTACGIANCCLYD